MWCQFTLDNLKHFYNGSIKIDDDNILLKFIKNERNKIKKFMSSNNIDITITPTNYSDTNILLLINKWVDKKLIDELSFLTLHFYIRWDNNLIIIQSFKDIPNLKKRITLIINIYEYLKYSNNSKENVTIYLILSRLIKVLPENNIIDVEHVNTGYSDTSNNTIFIWRYEEFEKVLFHEFIHFLDLDNKIISSKFLFNYNESITDFYGIIYYIIFLSLVTNIQIKKLLEIEMEFVKNQALLVSNFFNISSLKNITYIKQNTHAFSYYIFKYLIFNYIMSLHTNYNIDNIKNEFKSFSALHNYLFKTNINFKQNFIDINSTRMTILQLE